MFASTVSRSWRLDAGVGLPGSDASGGAINLAIIAAVAMGVGVALMAVGIPLMALNERTRFSQSNDGKSGITDAPARLSAAERNVRPEQRPIPPVATLTLLKIAF